MESDVRTLTHALIYDSSDDKWHCKCGYKLGDGHTKLYATCPMYHRDKAKRAYNEFNIGSPAHEKKRATKPRERQTPRAGAGISNKTEDLFG
jgi:hypothetical protein